MDYEWPDFEWLADLSKWQCFTTCELSRPAKSLDFGSDGFTASLTDWHELLQLTRPDATCGLVFLRGRFPDKAGSILSRAQRRDDTGSKGTFGTRLLPPDSDFPSDVELGERKAQGWVNFRWPYTQYELLRKDPVSKVITGTGSCETISFASKGTVYQVNRLKWGYGTSLGENEEGNVATARFRVGGTVRFGCPCSNTNGTLDSDVFTVTESTRSPGPGICCMSAKYQTSLEIGLVENGVPQRVTLYATPDGSTAQPWIDLSSEHRVELSVGEAVYLISTYALRNDTEDDAATEDGSLPKDLLDYLGISRGSVHMTDRLWTALCATNYEAVEAVEFCVVGRCVEQILNITSIPVRQPPRTSPANGPEKLERMPESALIGNIMTGGFVDVQSAFYQIRLLAKIYDFIRTRKFERDFLYQYRSLDEIRGAYLVRLRDAMRSALTWLFVTDLKPGRLLLAVHSEPTEVNAQGEPVNPANAARLGKCALDREQVVSTDGSYNRGCYATMAAWYVTRLCPEAMADQRFVDEIVVPNLPVAYQVGNDRANRNKQPSAKSNVLQWLHFSCILLLCEWLGWEENYHSEDDGLDLQQAAETQERFEKHVSRLKTSQADGWSMEHEELDRVLMLAEEMGLDRLKSLKKSHSWAITRARQTRRLIRDRKRTTKFNTGPTKQWMMARSISNGPWELLCSNHEAYLRVADEANVLPARDRLLEFLLSDYSFMASWDRAEADTQMLGRWWDVEPVAMICSTLLDLKLEGKLQAAAAISPPLSSGDDPLAQSITNARAETMNSDSADNPVRTAGGRPDPAQAELVAALVQQLRLSMDESIRIQLYEMRQMLGQEGDGTGSVKAFEWVTLKPSPAYYPVRLLPKCQPLSRFYRN
ncbi:hypothetical protein B0H63DRAFT_403053 [Podospora didyma]|uniref:Uncharacterized protein n=1 Tax=Podospora didyma TaxID=330526 RepID=A0AAE0K5D9_9PEZI|nr:hypothetical protein B0H63DRAFT_403053 [Podospora didyma]